MRILFAIYFVLAITACERPGTDHGITDDVRAKNTLKSVLVEARLAAYDNMQRLTSTSELISILEQHGHMTSILAYGRSNVFFNPRVSTWKEPSLSIQTEAEHAIVICRSARDYVGITFGGQIVRDSHCPVQWCK
jgi:hypothetical protein